MDILELLKEIVQIIIYTVITGCGVVVVRKVLEFVNKKIDQLQENTKLVEYEKLNKIIDNVQNSIYNIVNAVNQTFVDSLKEHNKFDKESAAAAKATATDKANAMLTEEAIEAITQLKGDVDVFIDTTIEAAVRQLKNK
jgi:hypothetical protein